MTRDEDVGVDADRDADTQRGDSEQPAQQSPQGASRSDTPPDAVPAPQDEDRGAVADSAVPPPAAGSPAAERRREVNGPAPPAPAETGSSGLGAILANASTAVAWGALLLAAVSLWLFMDAQRRAGQLLLEEQRGEAELLQRVQALESVSGQDTTTFDQMRSNLQRQIELEIEDLQARQQRFEEDQARRAERLEETARDAAASTARELGERIDALAAQFETLRDAQRSQSERIAQLGIADRDSWLLAEAQYLLRLANQRLIMTGDTRSALALMSSVDAILRELESVDLHRLRGALASDMVAVRAVPRLDTEGLYLRLDALIRQTDELVMFEMPEIDEPEPLAEDAPWRERLAYGYESAMAKLSEYIVISRRDTPIETLMDPQYEGLVRQNMRMLLEQAQVALLSGNQELYERSLERADGWVEEFFKDDGDAAQSMRDELAALAAEPVSVDMPNLSESLEAMDEAVRLRLERDRD